MSTPRTIDSILHQYGLPEDHDLERFVLGAAMIDQDAFHGIRSVLNTGDFSLEKHRRIFAAMVDLADSGESVDRLTLSRELIARNQLQAVDGFSYLVSLDDGLPPLLNLDGYVRIIREKAVLRRAAMRAYEIIIECCQPGAGIETVEQAERFYRELSTDTQRRISLRSFGEYAAEVGLDAVLNPHRNEATIITPWKELTGILGGGFRPGQLIVLAARPGLGKSAAAGQIALTAAHAGRTTDLFSLEMGHPEIWQRIIVQVSLVRLQDLRRGRLSDADMFALQSGSNKVSEMPIWVDDSTGATVPAITAAIQKQSAKGVRPHLVIIDYLQLMRGIGRARNRVEEVSEISRSLKLLSKEFSIPVVALSQLSRDSVKENREPQLSDLRESGAIEQDADIVMFLWQKPSEKAESIRTGNPCPTSLLVSKQRNGPVGRIELMFNAAYVRLEEKVSQGELI